MGNRSLRVIEAIKVIRANGIIRVIEINTILGFTRANMDIRSIFKKGGCGD